MLKAKKTPLCKSPLTSLSNDIHVKRLKKIQGLFKDFYRTLRTFQRKMEFKDFSRTPRTKDCANPATITTTKQQQNSHLFSS